MVTVSVRELKNRLGHYLACVARGEQVTVTNRGKAVAVILASNPESAGKTVEELVAEGLLVWKGGKPKGLPELFRLPGKPLSEYIIEGRG